jgi:hypothetical protein
MQFYRDAELRWGEVYVKSTDTRLALDAAMIKAIFRQLILFLAIQFVFWVRYFTGNRAPYTIGWVPGRPKPWYKIWNVTKWMGFKYSDDFAACDVLFYFEDKTHGSIDPDVLNSNKKILNGGCTDISKTRVEDVFERTFGYGLAVDPTSYAGKVVQKSEENAKHDGCIIDCPIEHAEPGFAYQRFIENCYDGKIVEDIRVPVVGDAIPFVYLKRRPIAIRFANDNTEAALVETVEALSETEVEQLLAFAREMGLDFGGLDVLRCRESGKIFVVDVNKTDMGPPIPLKTTDKFRALTRLGRAFVDMVSEKAA